MQPGPNLLPVSGSEGTSWVQSQPPTQTLETMAFIDRGQPYAPATAHAAPIAVSRVYRGIEYSHAPSQEFLASSPPLTYCGIRTGQRFPMLGQTLLA